MPLVAITSAGQRYEAWRLSPADWAALKDGYRAQGLRTACCGRAAVPVTSPAGWPFFRHAPGEACAASESAAHIVGKSIVARAAAALGLAVTTEARGDGWIADVLVEAPRWRVAVEVQLSRIPLDAVATRQRRYAADGVRGAWLLGYDLAGHEADPALPLFRLMPGGRDRAEPQVTPMAPGERRVRTRLERFTVKLLTGQVRFVPAAAGPHLVVVPAACPRCHRDVMAPIGFGRVEGHPILAPGGFLAVRDVATVPAVLAAYRQALPVLLERRPDLAVVRPRGTERAGWMVRCPACDGALPPHRGRPDEGRPGPRECWDLEGVPLAPDAPEHPLWTWTEP